LSKNAPVCETNFNVKVTQNRATHFKLLLIFNSSFYQLPVRCCGDVPAGEEFHADPVTFTGPMGTATLTFRWPGIEHIALLNLIS
jgi:hypothetical protein